MALPFLEIFTKDFSPVQLQSLEDLVERSKTGKTIGLDEAQALISKVKQGTEPLFHAPVFRQEILDGCKLSSALESLRADLTTLMTLCSHIEDDVNRQQEIERSFISKLHQAILRLDELIAVSRLHRENQDYTDIKFIDFVSTTNEATSPTKAFIDSDVGYLTSGTRDVVKYCGRTGALRPILTSNILSTGINPDASFSFTPDNSVVASDRYVWAEILLSDSTLSGVQDLTSYTGALVRLDIDLPQAELINEIKLAPFGNYPLKLVNATYLDGDIETSIPDLTLPMTLELDTTALRFSPVYSRRIRLTFNQPEFIFNQFAVERGQLKRSNWMNILLDKALENSVNKQGTLAQDLRDDRLNRAETALEQELSGIGQTKPIDRIPAAIENIVNVADSKLINIQKYQYVVGLRRLEVNYKRYYDTSLYITPALKATGSVFHLVLDSDETHINVNDGVADAPATSIEWSCDFGGGHIVELLPEGTTVVESERLEFDSTLVAKSRFNGPGTGVIVRRDGRRLTLTTDYTVAVVSSKVQITLVQAAFRPNAVYTVDYDVTAGQDTISLLSLYQSIKPSGPEVFTRTGDHNRISLKAHPFVITELTHANRYWAKPNPNNARWYYRGPISRSATSDPAFIVAVDGESFGGHPSTLRLTGNINSTVTTFTVTSTGGATLGNGFPQEGVIKIGDELIKYTEYTNSGANIVLGGVTPVIRGYNNTANAAHVTTDRIDWMVLPYYEPITVLVNDNPALNITDYANGENPAFTDKDGPYQYVQIGTTLYFDRPINGKIEVWYRTLADYISVQAKLRSHLPTKEYTAAVNNFTLKMKTSTL